MEPACEGGSTRFDVLSGVCDFGSYRQRETLTRKQLARRYPALAAYLPVRSPTLIQADTAGCIAFDGIPF